MSEIAGQHVLITGGASGIGRLMAKKLAALGCRISVWDIHRQNLDTVVAELNAAAGGSAQGFLCDVSKRAVVYRAAEETREPEKTIPRALFVGVLIVTACYVALNAAYFHVLLPEEIARSTRVAADAADAVLGHGGAAFMSAAVVVSTFGALNGVILSGPRAYLAMGNAR